MDVRECAGMYSCQTGAPSCVQHKIY